MTNQGSRIINITEKPVRKHHLTFAILVEACMFRLTGWFHIHLLLFI